MNMWPFIEVEEAEQHSVKRACDLLEVSRAAYYEQRKHIPRRRALDDAELTERIKAIHAESKGTYGAPRIHARLRRDGICCGKKRVARLMVRAGLAGRCPRRWRKTTVADPNAEARAVDLIKRVFGPDTALDTRWVGDVTYISTWEGWAYLATVIDLASRRVVGWALADHMRTDLVADALRMACVQRRPPAGVIFHSDRGCQYTSKDFAALAAELGVTLSLGRKGECWDKGFDSHCTSLRLSDRNSPGQVASLAFHETWIARGGRIEHADVAVVGLVAREQPGPVPGLDRGRTDTERRGHLLDAQLAGGAEPLVTAREAMVAS